MNNPVVTKQIVMTSDSIHQNITLTCQVSSYPTSQIIWRFQQGKYNVIVGNSTNLELVNVDASNAGEYICIAKSGVIEKSSSYKLLVERKYTIIF